MLIPTLTTIAKPTTSPSPSPSRRLPLATKPLRVPLDGPARASRSTACKAQKDDLYNRVIPQLDPDIIITMNAYEDPTQFRPVPRA